MSIRQVYVIKNQDWLAPQSNLTDQEAYKAIVDLWLTVSDEQYDTAVADLKTAGLNNETEDDRG